MRVFATTDDEHEARFLARDLYVLLRYAASVVLVGELPDPPPTSDRYAIVVDWR